MELSAGAHRRCRRVLARTCLEGQLRSALDRVLQLEAELADARAVACLHCESGCQTEPELCQRLELAAPVLRAGIAASAGKHQPTTATRRSAIALLPNVVVARRHAATHNFLVPASKIASMSLSALNVLQRGPRRPRSRRAGKIAVSPHRRVPEAKSSADAVPIGWTVATRGTTQRRLARPRSLPPLRDFAGSRWFVGEHLVKGGPPGDTSPARPHGECHC
jgi:hypothetical protein